MEEKLTDKQFLITFLQKEIHENKELIRKYKEEIIRESDIKPGDMVKVIANNDECSRTKNLGDTLIGKTFKVVRLDIFDGGINMHFYLDTGICGYCFERNELELAL